MLPSLVADMDIAAPVVHFLRAQGVDVLSAREEGWGDLTDSEILARAHAMAQFVLTHDSDFGTLAVHRGEAITGILYLRPGGRPPAEVKADMRASDSGGDRLDTTGHCCVPCGTSATPEAFRRDMIGMRDHPSVSSLTIGLCS